MSYNIVAIPTREQWKNLEYLIQDLLDDSTVREIFVFDNSPAQEAESRLSQILEQESHRLRIVGAPDEGIYKMWNRGIDLGKRIEEMLETDVYVAILNDDLRIPELFIDSLSKAMNASGAAACYPDWTEFTHDAPTPPEITWRETTGTGKDHGMSGWAFMLRASCAPFVDDRFVWWCGDDDIERTIRANGGEVICVKGVGLTHFTSSTAQLHPELHAIGWEDVERFKEKWGSW